MRVVNDGVGRVGGGGGGSDGLVIGLRCTGAKVDNVVRLGKVEAVAGWWSGISEVVLGG